MHITLTCRACGLTFKVDSRFAGKVGACPRPECGRKFLVPVVAEPVGAATASPTRKVAAGVQATERARAAADVRAAPGRPSEPDAGDDDVDWLFRHAGVESDAGSNGARRNPAAEPRRPLPPRSRDGSRDERDPRQRARGERPANEPAEGSTGGTLSLPRRLAAVGQRGMAWVRRSRWNVTVAIGGGVASILAAVGLLFGVAGALRTSDAPSASGDTAAANADAARKAALFGERVQPYLTRYCVDCHSGDGAEAGIQFETFVAEDSARQDRRTWEKVARMLESGAMPPGDHEPRPTAAETGQFVAWLDARVFHVDCTLPRDPGRVTVRRLNRNEYNNTIRDLVGVSFRPADDFPSDDVGHGFDNIGDVLSLPPLLMEKYLDAAEKIAEAAIVSADPTRGATQAFSGEQLQRDAKFELTEGDFVGLYSAGQVSHAFDFPHAGEYTLKVEAQADQAGPETAKMELRIDGRAVKTFDVEGNRRPAVYETKVTVQKGRKTVAAVFTNDFYNPNARDRRQRDRNLYVKSISVTGPHGLAPENLPDSHRRIVIVRPDKDRSVEQAAREVLLPFARRAFRRPVDEADVVPFVELVELAVAQGDTFERGVQVGVAAILVSPHFLFRVESDPDPHDPAAKHAISDYELASRLSYFLWSTMPDAELFRLAATGTLHQPDVLKQQTRRMLADARSAALVENFAGQWLNLRNLDELTPDPGLFPEFDAALRADMRTETELFVQAIVREDRSLLDFLDGRYTFLNDRLAKHYDLPAPGGGDFQKVHLSDDRRGGVLTHASILTLTSDPTKTSPVKRGKWILENILGTPPPPPPPNVPEFDVAKKANPNASLAEQLRLHRTNPTCASCHKAMDPLGLGFENFDPLGRWRDAADGRPVDPAGTLPSGESFRKPAELRKILMGRERQFTRHLSDRLLTYALGRGLDFHDKCAVDQIADAVAKNGHRFSELVWQVVSSEPFLMRRGEGAGAPRDR